MLLTLDYFIDMDSGHSSAFDVMDTDQDRFDMNLENSDVNAAAVAATPTAAAPTTATISGKIRRCPCRRRMSSLSYDHNFICSFCRGFDYT